MNKTHLWPLGLGDRWLFAELFVWLSAMLAGGLGRVEVGTPDASPEGTWELASACLTACSLHLCESFLHNMVE